MQDMYQQPTTIDVTAETFQQVVVDGSFNHVVIVDFWAAWCAPCKMLGPVLERVAASYGGKVLIAKVNVDQEQEIATHFAIRSIPTVKIVYQGAIAQEFTGALTEPEVRRMITTILGAEEPAEDVALDDLIAEERFDEAERLCLALFQKDATNLAARAGLARITLHRGDTAPAKKLIEEVRPEERDTPEIRTLEALVGFVDDCRAAGGLDVCKTAFDADAKNLDAAYRLGACLVASRQYRDALEVFLDSVRRDRAHDDGKARKAMVRVFDILGGGHVLTGEYRNKLASVLF